MQSILAHDIFNNCEDRKKSDLPIRHNQPVEVYPDGENPITVYCLHRDELTRLLILTDSPGRCNVPFPIRYGEDPAVSQDMMETLIEKSMSMKIEIIITSDFNPSIIVLSTQDKTVELKNCHKLDNLFRCISDAFPPQDYIPDDVTIECPSGSDGFKISTVWLAFKTRESTIFHDNF